MIPRIAVESITFSGGQTINLSPDDVVVIVGPNNVGKSATLGAIRAMMEKADRTSPIISAIKFFKEGDDPSLEHWLRSIATKHSDGADDRFSVFGATVSLRNAKTYWHNQSGRGLADLTRFFCNLISTEGRLQAANPPQNIALTKDAPVHPIHHLQRDDGLERRLSAQFRSAFDRDLIVHRNAGAQVPLHVGDRPVPGDGQDRVSLEYIRELEKLPQLHHQGDGMRSFGGVLLNVSVGQEPLVLIDEPEAFLHPPQARLLGRFLVQNKTAGRQLFVATHSGDVVRGVLDAGSTNVRIVRIQRHGEVNNASELVTQRVAELWKDPLLRYSNIFDA
jgi:hypothetical protein